MALKAALALRYEQTKRLAPAISLLIQAATLSGVLYSLLSWRGLGPWIMPLFFVAIIASALSLSWLYYDGLGMRRHERAALLNLDPMQQDQLTPKEQTLLFHAVKALGGDQESLDALREAARTGRLK